MFSGRGGSRNYRISGRGGGPSLTDVLVIFYLLLQSVPINHSKGTKISKREGRGVEVFRRCGVGLGVEVLILIPKETYNTCNFPGLVGGGGDPDLLTPHLSLDSEIKRIGRNDRFSQIYGCSMAAS